MFNTDDGVYIDNVNVEKSVYELIRQNPFQASFRLYLGKNIFGCYKSSLSNVGD